MKVLVITFNDSDNLAIENVLYEMKRRGHEVTIFAPFQDDSSMRMFRDLNIAIRPIKELNNTVASKFDVAFLTNMTMQYAKLLDIYCFAYSSYIDETFMPDGADFLFTYRGNCWPRVDYRCPSMPVGDPKNDLQAFNPTENTKRILYVDSGHMPFGRKGKEQIADMLLDICEQHPDYEICIKPRWLRSGSTNCTHRNTDHIYTVIEERCSHQLPANLNMLNEHYNLSELIDKSDCVVTLYTGAILNVVLQGKSLVIATGWDNEDKYDLRNEVEIKQQKELYSESGCTVPYNEVAKYLPAGFQPNEAFKRKMILYREGASGRIVDVMEYVFEKYISKGLFPAIKEYKFETFHEEMYSDPSINFAKLKQERIRERMQFQGARVSYSLVGNVDFGRYYQQIENEYQKCPLSEAGYNTFQRKCNSYFKEIIVENADIFEKDEIDQSRLFQALYDLGRGDELISVPTEKIKCPGAYHYYLGQLFRNKGQKEDALHHYLKYINIRISRSYAKYPCDEDWGVGNAYNFIFACYDGENIFADEFADLYCALCERWNITVVSYANRRRAHNVLPKVAEKLVNADPERALKCLQLYVKYNYHYNIRERDEKIKALTRNIRALQSSRWYKLGKDIKWPFQKIKGGIKCLQEHGWSYTWKRFQEKVINKYGSHTVFRIWNVFKHKVIRGFNLYSEEIKKYGEGAFVFLPSFATGDVYMFGSVFDAYLKKHGSPEFPVFVVYGKGSIDIADMFDIPYVKDVTMEEFRALFNFLMFDTSRSARILNLHYHVYYRHIGILGNLMGLHGFNFRSLALATLDIPENEAKLPSPKYEAYELEEIVRQTCIIPNRTVILTPYAKSVKRLPQRFWIRVVGELKNRGLFVCTNVVGNEEPILGTTAISPPYRLVIALQGLAGALIGIRNGYHDVTNTAECLKVSITVKDAPTPFICSSEHEAFHLRNMYHQKDQYDFLYSQETEDGLINQIIELVDNYFGNRRNN